jgi:transcriptional regulator with XRE-family HTH domain
MADEEILLALGKRIRSVRLRAGLDQRHVAAAAGTSPSTVGRMEIGHGGRVSLDTWLAVAEALGLPPLGWARPEVPFGVVMEGIAEAGGWRRSGLHADALIVDREPRPMAGLRHVQLPAERAVILGIPVLSDPDVEWRRLRRAIDDVHRSAPAGRSVCGVLIVSRHGSNTRMAGPSRGRSDGPWLRTLRDPGTAMPSRPGWVWLAPRGTHLLPGG